MPLLLEGFYKEALKSIQAFNNFVNQYQLTDKAVSDHLSYKCASADEFHQLRQLFEGGSDYIFQSIISKRRIDIIKLINPIETSCGPVFFLELSDQKPDGSQKSGFDHLEFFPSQNSVQDFVKYLTDKNITVIKADRPHHITYDISLEENFKIRIEPESLIKKIIREEMLF